MKQKQAITSKKQDLLPVRNEKGQIISGTANPYGRPTGTKNFETLFRESLKVLAKKDGRDPDEFELEIMSTYVEQARKGNYRFLKDMYDRKFGKAKESMDITSGGQPLGVPPERQVEIKKALEDLN